MKNNRKRDRVKDSVFFVLKQIGGAVIICSVVLCSVFQVSCRMTEEGIELVAGDVTCPQIEEFKVMNNSSLKLTCSKEFVLSDLSVCQEEFSDEVSDYGVEAVYGDDRKSAMLYLDKDTDIGKSYLLAGKAKDKNGNSLGFRLKFTGYNDHPAKLQFSEIRTDYTKATSKLPARTEIAELVVTESGNTTGLEIVSGNYGEDKKYSFPGIEVKAGDVIVVHYRSIGDGCIDETGDNLDAAYGPESSGARDLWVAGNSKLLTRNDVIVLRNNGEGCYQDAVLICESGKVVWSKDAQAKMAAEAVEQGVWTGGAGVESAACSDGLTATHTLKRISGGGPGSRELWKVVSGDEVNVGSAG